MQDNLNFTSLLYKENELKEFSDNFAIELSKASKNEPSSISFLQTELPQNKDRIGDKIQMISVGGSTYHSISTNSNDINKGDVPKFHNKSDFLLFMDKIIDKRETDICLAFAYPMKPLLRTNKPDGTLFRLTKGNKFEGLIGKNIGEEIEKYFEKQYGIRLNIYVANDVVSASLSGLNKYPKESLASLVVGTGTNMALFHDHSAINLESGNFDKFNMTESGAEIDAESNNKGNQLFEKEISGAYLYKHFNYLNKKFNLNYSELKDTQELNLLIKTKGVGYELGTILFERSTSLNAVQIAGLYKFKQQKILNIIAEGSMFWEGYKYEENTRRYLKILKIDNQKINFIEIEHSSLYGAKWLAGF